MSTRASSNSLQSWKRYFQTNDHFEVLFRKNSRKSKRTLVMQGVRRSSMRGLSFQSKISSLTRMLQSPSQTVVTSNAPPSPPTHVKDEAGRVALAPQQRMATLSSISLSLQRMPT